jgi:hypothetical protein
MEGRIERALLDAEDLTRHLLHALGNTPSMLGLEREGAEDKEVEGALRQIDA